MKVKVYTFGEKVEAKLSDDTIVVQNAKESVEDFMARLKAMVFDEHLDDEFEVIDITLETVAENDDETLKQALVTSEGLQKQMIQQVLVDRKLIVGKPAAKARIQPMTVEEMKATDLYKGAEANIGKHASFSPFKSEEVYEGKIAGVALNKTNTIVYYTIVEASGKRRCCGVLNESVKFIDAPAEDPNTVKAPTAKEKAAALKAEKAAAKAAKTETAPKTESTDAPEADLEAAGDDLM